MKNQHSPWIMYLSLPLALCLVGVSLTGWLTPDFYFRETSNWAVQSRFQDMVDLVLITPVLVISAFFTANGFRIAALIWVGTLLYLVYTFLLYTFHVHFNPLFYFYCLTLGLSFYALLYFSTTQYRLPHSRSIKSDLLRNTLSVFLIVIGVAFYMLWLTDVHPYMATNTTPRSLADVGLPTNGVHVIDLSIILPVMIMTGILVLRKNQLAPTWRPYCLCLCS